MAANRGQTFLVMAILLGLAAAVVGYFSLTQLATRAANASNANMRPVVVTASDLTYGQKLEPAMLRVVNYPKDAVPLGAFSTMDSAVGQTTKVFMGAREPVTSLKLSSRGGGLSLTIRPSMRAVSCEVNQVSGVSGFVLPGDRVDVLVTVRPRTASDDPITETVLQNTEVLAAGQKTQTEGNKPITVQAVTMLLDPSGAQVLTHAQREGEIMLVLRNPEDRDTLKVAGLSTGKMLGKQAPEVGRTRYVTKTVQAPAPSQPKPSMPREVFMIRGGNVGKAVVPDSTR